MHQFTLSSGKQLFYDVNTNEICLRQKNAQANLISHFIETEEVVTDSISLFTIELTQQCNLRCRYCCFSGKYSEFRSHNDSFMDYGLIEQCLDFIYKNASKDASEITVCFYGGEALLALDKMKWMTSRLINKIGDRVCFSLSTNGYALTDSVVDWICSVDRFYLNVTVDGNQAMHDANRKTLKGVGSYNTIIGNLRNFRNRHPAAYQERVRFLSTVYSWQDVKCLSEVWNYEPALQGMTPVHISHIIPNFGDKSRAYDTWEAKNSFFSEAFEHYKLGLKDIMSEAFKKQTDIVGRRKIFRCNDEMKLLTCLQEMTSCFINVKGDLYACEKFGPFACLGNVENGFDREAIHVLQRLFVELKNRHCRDCWALRLCRLCLTCLNFKDENLSALCKLEKESIDISLKYFCEMKDWEIYGKR